jgi:hypothetical protein
MPGRAAGRSGLEDDPAGDAAGGLRAVRLGCLRERIHRADLGAQVPLVDPLMVAYRRTIFAKIVSALGQIGLATPRVLHGLGQLGMPHDRRAGAR